MKECLMPNKININNTLMNQMMYKEINVNKILYKTLITTNFYSKSIRYIFISAKIKKKGRIEAG